MNEENESANKPDIQAHDKLLISKCDNEIDDSNEKSVEHSAASAVEDNSCNDTETLASLNDKSDFVINKDSAITETEQIVTVTNDDNVLRETLEKKNENNDESSNIREVTANTSIGLMKINDEYGGDTSESECESESQRAAFSERQTEASSYTDSSEDNNNSNDSESSSDDEIIFKKSTKDKGQSRHNVTSVRGELTIYDLPPIEDLHITVPEDECLPLGTVYSIVETLVVIKSLPNTPALNLDSILFWQKGEALGQIFDVFGPVKSPFYSIRFNSNNEIKEKNIVVGTTVYCAPKTEHTNYVFTYQLMQHKGSDASWKDNKEPPDEFLEYSDDEQERMANKNRYKKIHNTRENETTPLPKQPKTTSTRKFNNNRNWHQQRNNKNSTSSISTPVANVHYRPQPIISPPLMPPWQMPLLYNSFPIYPNYNQYPANNFPQIYQNNFQSYSSQEQNISHPSPSSSPHVFGQPASFDSPNLQNYNRQFRK